MKLLDKISEWFNKNVGIEDLDEEEVLFNILSNEGCADCGCKEFRQGPSGGISQNIMCDKCGSRYNITPMVGRAQRIS